MLLMKIVGFVDGRPTPFDGQYVVEYNPSREGIDPFGRPWGFHLVCTADPQQARVFADLAEFKELWAAVDQRNPVRLDGKPNRPLTAFTVATERA